MTAGVGTSNQAQALETLSDMTAGASPITRDEYLARIRRAQTLMQSCGLDLLFLNAGSNLLYFTGTHWNPSERLVGALLPASGELEYIAPHFERATLQQHMLVEGAIHCWHEHQDPYRLLVERVRQLCKSAIHSRLAISDDTPFFVVNGIRQADPAMELSPGSAITLPCRMRKSNAEIALIRQAMEMTLEVQRATASILRQGVTTLEVEAFIQQAHQKVGASGNYFCIVLFGEATAYPHGVPYPQTLRRGDMVLIDTGCQLHDYISDITRSYIFGEPDARQREVWGWEKQAQAAAFAAAIPGAACESVDQAARHSLEAVGLGPGYQLPGLPHRTGHGIGFDIHEGPYLVGGETTPLQPGMCFSNEPMICIPGEFGVRLEDHFYMTDGGPQWFTRPAHSIDDPFNLSNC